MVQPINIAVVDDQPLFREGVCNALTSTNQCHLVGEGADFDDAVDIARTLKPDVMLLDVHLPGGGIAALKMISKAVARTRTIMLTAQQSEADLSASFRAGARGYIVKGVRAEQLAEIVNTVHGGGMYTEPQFASALLARRYEKLHGDKDVLSTLTCRERDILTLVSKGLTNKEIAGSFKLAEKTVKHYMTNILQKLQARNRVEAALIARKLMVDEIGQEVAENGASIDNATAADWLAGDNKLKRAVAR